MPVEPLSQSPARVVESLLYLVHKLGKPTTIHEVLKLRYFADKVHLSRYGSLASGDTYVAMKFGPVGSTAFNLLKAARGERSQFIEPQVIEAADRALNVDAANDEVKALRQPRGEMLSPADVECMDAAVAKFGALSFEERTKLSHDAAWSAARNEAIRKKVAREAMPLRSIVATLQNAEEVIEYLED